MQWRTCVVGSAMVALVSTVLWPGCSGEGDTSGPTTTAQGGAAGGTGGAGATGAGATGGGGAGASAGAGGQGGAGGQPPVACCTPEGIGCCTTEPGGDDWCHEADPCVVSRCRNGQEVCDDEGVSVDPTSFQYFLLCQTAGDGVGYAATNSGGPCDASNIARCRCWEESNQAPWDNIDYVAQLLCDQVGKRVEVIFPNAGNYYIGVHATPGNYAFAGHCPTGDGCMTSIALLGIPR